MIRKAGKKIKFYKYHGAGNDFVMIDGRKIDFPYKRKALVKSICDRRTGVGADGLIVLTKPKVKGKEKKNKFSMVYLNSDGSIGSMCGNGGRCIVRFARDLKIIKDNQKIFFDAVDGLHEAQIKKSGEVNLKMIDMKKPVKRNTFLFNYCGTTPHHVDIINDIFTYPLVEEARTFRDRVKESGGVNLNVVQKNGSVFLARTYERGVEDETLACGTGACAIATVLYENQIHPLRSSKIQSTSPFARGDKKVKYKIKMLGGLLHVSFTPTEDGFEDVWLSGPTEKVFDGEIEL